jgi:hypothetical protein
MYFLHLGQVANEMVRERRRHAELLRQSKKHRLELDFWAIEIAKRLRTQLQGLFDQRQKSRRVPENLMSDQLVTDC